MDPLTHTLVGASLAETRLTRATPLAAATLIVGANLPDMDAAMMFLGGDAALGARRGWTHGVLAVAVLPWLLAAAVALFDRLVRRRRDAALKPVQFGPVLGLAYLSVLTHPCLDWLNTYGIRLLMPFDGRWFYGDAIFIVDPWIWLLAGSAVVLAHTRSPSSIAAWVVPGTLLTLLVTGVNLVPVPAKVVWCGGVSLIVGVRVWGGLQHRIARVAALTLASVVLYAGLMVAVSHLTRWRVERWLAAGAVAPQQIMTGPVLANPFVRDVIVIDADHYHFLEVNWLAAERIRVSDESIPREGRGPIIEAALQAPHVQGLRTWMRFPSYEVENLGDGYRVVIDDVRYSRAGPAGLGTAVVELDRDLNLRQTD